MRVFELLKKVGLPAILDSPVTVDFADEQVSLYCNLMLRKPISTNGILCVLPVYLCEGNEQKECDIVCMFYPEDRKMYGCTYIPLEELLGYHVCEKSLANYGEADTAANILWEAGFNDFTDEITLDAYQHISHGHYYDYTVARNFEDCEKLDNEELLERLRLEQRCIEDSIKAKNEYITACANQAKKYEFLPTSGKTLPRYL